MQKAGLAAQGNNRMNFVHAGPSTALPPVAPLRITAQKLLFAVFQQR
jgi:hypothetical protein